MELFGKTRFPMIRDAAYLVTLGPHGFYWFSLPRPTVEQERLSMPPSAPVIESASLDALLLGEDRALLNDILPGFLETRTWYGGRRRTLRSVAVTDVVRAEAVPQPIYFLIARAEYLDADSEDYLLPLVWVPGESPVAGGATLAIVSLGAEAGRAAARGARSWSATEDPAASRALLALVARGTGDETIVGTVLPGGEPTETDFAADPRRIGRSNHATSIRFADRFVLRLSRRLEEG